MEIGFAADAFKNKDIVTDLLNAKVFGLVVFDKKFLAEDKLKEIQEYEAKEAKP